MSKLDAKTIVFKHKETGNEVCLADEYQIGLFNKKEEFKRIGTLAELNKAAEIEKKAKEAEIAQKAKDRIKADEEKKIADDKKKAEDEKANQKPAEK